jgi:hypothetical protein
VCIHHGSISHLRELVQRKNKKEKKGQKKNNRVLKKKYFISPFFVPFLAFYFHVMCFDIGHKEYLLLVLMYVLVSTGLSLQLHVFSIPR